MIRIFIFFFMTLAISGHTQSGNFLVNIESGSFYSETLQMEKSYQVFLPESYHYSNVSTYPVIYLIDGDYNFYYQTGVVEMLSNISEKIPEAIVVGISDNGNSGYRKDCTLKTEKNPEGNTLTFIEYLEKELKPKIKKQFRVSSYEILIGHSLGGLFATNVLLHRPEAFDAYIAIDPSYWWEDYLIVLTADSLLKGKDDIEANLFVTLANSKGMGVHEFIGVIEKRFPDTKKFTFKYYENETHGSVGMSSVKDGLVKIFENWELPREKFYELGTATKVMKHYLKLSEQYQGITRIPPLLFSNIIYYFFRTKQPDELDIIETSVNKNFPASSDDFYAKLGSYLLETKKYTEAETLLKKSINENPKAYKSYDALSKLHYAQAAFEVSKTNAEKAVNIAKELKVRQWQLNELESNLNLVTKKSK